MVTKRGTPASSEAKAFAIRTALKVCNDLGLVNYLVFSDCRRTGGRLAYGYR